MVNEKLACSLSGIAHYRRLQCFSAAGCRLASASGVAGMDAGALLVGEKLPQRKPIAMKKHG